MRTSVRATVTRASSGRPMTLGTISAATMAMITSTTIISISVTPLSPSRRGRRPARQFCRPMRMMQHYPICSNAIYADLRCSKLESGFVAVAFG